MTQSSWNPQWKPLNFQYDDAGRPQILEAAQMTRNTYVDSHFEECREIGHDLPPRMGKSTLIHVLAIELRAEGAPFVLALTPWTNLARQLADREKVRANCERVKVNGWTGQFVTQAITSISHAGFWERKAAGKPPYTLLTSTVHLTNANRDVVERGIRLAYERTGKRPVIIIDETHLFKMGQRWADTVMAFREAGAFIISMTGTAERSDSGNIIGFNQEQKSEWEQKHQSVVVWRGPTYIRDADGLLVRDVRIEDRVVQECEVVTKASGITVTWDVAFNNGWLHPVSAEPSDFKVVQDGHPIQISEVERSIVRRNLGTWVRSEECCRQLASQAVDALSQWRSYPHLRHTKILVVTSSDRDDDKGLGGKKDDKQANFHAREMRRQILHFIDRDPILSDQSINVEISTSVNDDGEPDEKAAEKIRRFGLTRPDKNGNEPVDVLIVKAMGIVGLDVPECKILVDASTYRKGPMKKQLATRNLTVWTTEKGRAPEAQTFYPHDPDNFDFYESLTRTSEQGRQRVVEDCHERAAVVEVSGPDPLLPLLQKSGHKSGYQDEFGKWIEGDHDELIRQIHVCYPTAIALRRSQLLELAAQGAFPIDAEKAKAVKKQEKEDSRFVDLSEELEEERRKDLFGDKARRLASQIVSYRANPDRWRQCLIRLQAEAKKLCRISPDEPVESIQDPEIIRSLKRALDEVYPAVLKEYLQNAAD